MYPGGNGTVAAAEIAAGPAASSEQRSPTPVGGRATPGIRNVPSNASIRPPLQTPSPKPLHNQPAATTTSGPVEGSGGGTRMFGGVMDYDGKESRLTSVQSGNPNDAASPAGSDGNHSAAQSGDGTSPPAYSP
ncbi:hypothetical protein BD413DRAFT_656744 [Trametes elegans]|nr:hypothetical protein BD413DRAFT_656744 [Trametes elegans]